MGLEVLVVLFAAKLHSQHHGTHEEGHESDESYEGNEEGHEGDEGYEGDEEGHEDDEGHESDEGNESDEMSASGSAASLDFKIRSVMRVLYSLFLTAITRSFKDSF